MFNPHNSGILSNIDARYLKHENSSVIHTCAMYVIGSRNPYLSMAMAAAYKILT